MGTGDNGGCLGILGYSGYPEYICLDWVGGGPYAEEFIIYHSLTEDGNFTELVRTTEKEYQNYSLDYDMPHYFYIVPHSSLYGNGPKSRIYKSYRSQKYSTNEFILHNNGNIIDFDIGPTKMLILSYVMNNKVLEIIDLTNGSTISTFTNATIDMALRVFVNYNDDIYLLSDDRKTISKFETTTQLVSAVLNSDTQFDNVDIDKIENRLYLTKENSTTMEVYSSELESDFQFSLNPNFQQTRFFVIGNNSKIYISTIDGKTEFGRDRYVLEVASNTGELLETYESVSLNYLDWNKPEVDSAGNVYETELGLGSSTFLYKKKFFEDRLEFVANLGDLELGDDLFRLDQNDNVYKVNRVSGTSIYKITPDE